MREEMASEDQMEHVMPAGQPRHMGEMGEVQQKKSKG